MYEARCITYGVGSSRSCRAANEQQRKQQTAMTVIKEQVECNPMRCCHYGVSNANKRKSFDCRVICCDVLLKKYPR